MRVMGRCLEIPDHLSGVGIQRDDAACIEVVALTVGVRNYGLRIAGSDVDQVEVGIVGRHLPRHAAAVPHRLFVGPGLAAGIPLLERDHRPAPLLVAGLGVVRGEIAGAVEIVARNAGNHFVLDDHRSHGAVVELVEVAVLFPPTLGPVLEVQRNDLAVGRQEEKPVAGNAYSAVADVPAAFRFEGLVPDLLAIAGVDGPHVIGHCEIQGAIDHERCGLQAADAGAEGPCRCEAANVLIVDPGQRTEAAAGVVAMIGRPGSGRGLRQRDGREGQDGKDCDSLHFSVTR